MKTERTLGSPKGGANQGAKPSGAFGEEVSSRFVFASREHSRALGDGPFSVEGSWTLLAGKADYPSSAMVQAGSGLYAAGARPSSTRAKGRRPVSASRSRCGRNRAPGP